MERASGSGLPKSERDERVAFLHARSALIDYAPTKKGATKTDIFGAEICED